MFGDLYRMIIHHYTKKKLLSAWSELSSLGASIVASVPSLPCPVSLTVVHRSGIKKQDDLGTSLIMHVSRRKVGSTFIEHMDFIIECSYCRTPDGHAIYCECNFMWFLFVIFTFTVYNYSLLTHDLISMPRLVLYVRHPDNKVYGTAMHTFASTSNTATHWYSVGIISHFNKKVWSL